MGILCRTITTKIKKSGAMRWVCLICAIIAIFINEKKVYAESITYTVGYTAYNTAQSKDIYIGMDTITLTGSKNDSGTWYYGLVQDTSLPYSDTWTKHYTKGGHELYDLYWNPGSSASVQTKQVVTCRVNDDGDDYDTGKKISLNLKMPYTSQLVYQLNGGSGSIATNVDRQRTTTQPSARTVTLSTSPTHSSGYYFAGWSTQSYSVGEGVPQYLPGGSISLAYSNANFNGTIVTLYAVWWKNHVRMNVGGSWKAGVPFVNDNGVWMKPKKVYVNVNGTWKQVSS